MINVSDLNGIELITIENDSIRATFLPQVGGKMVELTNLKTGSQFLLEPKGGLREIKLPAYGDPYEREFAYGFDECFPTISPSPNPETPENKEMEGIEFPDHGELWSRPWKYDIKGEKLMLHAFGVQSDYVFRKIVTFEGNKIKFEYFLKSFSEVSQNYVWCAHVMLKVASGARIVLPSSVKEVFLDHASDPAVGKPGTKIAWPPKAGPHKTDLSVVGEFQSGLEAKFFADSLHEGSAELIYPSGRESIKFNFDSTMIPVVGIWLSYGGWPPEDGRKELAIAIEPGRGKSDSLVAAFERGEAAVLKAGAEDSWSWSLTVADKK